MLKRRLTRRWRREGERGQSLVEFALLVPIFLVLVFAIVDFGLGFHAYITVTNAAREGARLGAIGASASTIQQRVVDTSQSLDQSKLTVTVTGAQGATGTSVVVDVDYQYDLITPLSSVLQLAGGSSLGSTLDFSSTADMRIE